MNGKLNLTVGEGKGGTEIIVRDKGTTSQPRQFRDTPRLQNRTGRKVRRLMEVALLGAGLVGGIKVGEEVQQSYRAATHYDPGAVCSGDPYFQEKEKPKIQQNPSAGWLEKLGKKIGNEVQHGVEELAKAGLRETSYYKDYCNAREKWGGQGDKVALHGPPIAIESSLIAFVSMIELLIWRYNRGKKKGSAEGEKKLRAAQEPVGRLADGVNRMQQILLEAGKGERQKLIALTKLIKSLNPDVRAAENALGLAPPANTPKLSAQRIILEPEAVGSAAPPLLESHDEDAAEPRLLGAHDEDAVAPQRNKS